MSYPKKFDTSNLDEEQKLILIDFHHRRTLFNKYLADNNVALHTCPGCGYPTLTERGGYEICYVCNWEDDNQDDETADEIWGGPNYQLSLMEGRLNIGKQLKEIAEKNGGQITISPAKVMSILYHHDEKIKSLFETAPTNADLNHPVFEQYNKEGQELLQQLVTN